MYVDDIIFIAKEPTKYITWMEYHLKGVDMPKYCLGGDMELGKDEKMSWSAKIYIKNISERIENSLRCVSGLGTAPWLRITTLS